MVKNTNVVEVPAFVESAEYKTSLTSGWMLCIVIMVHFSRTAAQKIWDTLMIEGSSVPAISYGRRKAKELAIACGLEKRPSEDEVSKLVGHEVRVRLAVDDDGDIKVLKYMPSNSDAELTDGELPF